MGKLGLIGDGEIFWKGKLNISILPNGDWLCYGDQLPTEGQIISELTYFTSVEAVKCLQQYPLDEVHKEDTQKVERFLFRVDTT